MKSFVAYNYPSPYQNPSYNYDNGPQLTNYELNKNGLNGEEVPDLRPPFKHNPFMNLTQVDFDSPQLFDGHDDQFRPINYSSKNLNKNIKNDFESGLIMNPESVFWNRANSQRQYYSVPVATVPNAQSEFATWLYYPGNVCKNGSIYMDYGVKYTDDSLVCTGFNVAEPTNFGLDSNFSSSVNNS